MSALHSMPESAALESRLTVALEAAPQQREVPVGRVERVTGLDATLIHLETRENPMHTLKVVVLGASDEKLTLPDLKQVISARLGYADRLTQRLVEPTVLRARGFWVPVEVDIDEHVDEATLAAPGDERALEELCSRLAEKHLPRHRPLWAATLLHGLEGGRQAIVLKLHHGIADGLASMNLFVALTTAEPGQFVPPRPAPSVPDHIPGPRWMTAKVVTEVRALVADVPGLIKTTREAGRAVAELTHCQADVPRLLRAPRNSFSPRSGADRVCASVNLPIAEVREIAKLSGTTINGALHAILAGGIRKEYGHRGDRLDHPTVAIMGVATDTKSQRTQGNEIATMSVFLRSDIIDPLERLRATARSCAAGVERRRAKGFDTALRLKNYGTRLGPVFRPLAKDILPVVVNHVTTANVPGPQHTRYLGPFQVERWISYAVAVSPADVNITCHSYDGQIAVGLISTPEAMPDPRGFLARIEVALAELRAAVLAENPPVKEVALDADGTAA